MGRHCCTVGVVVVVVMVVVVGGADWRKDLMAGVREEGDTSIIRPCSLFLFFGLPGDGLAVQAFAFRAGFLFFSVWGVVFCSFF